MQGSVRVRRVPGLVLLVSAALALFGACGVDKYEFVPEDEEPMDDAGPVPPATPTVCGSDADCADLPSTQVCDRGAGYCVECLPEREAELNRCGDGLICLESKRCGIGCASDADCFGLTCDVARGLCVGCTGNGECTPGTVCSDAVCTPGCDTSEGCPGGWECCAGSCVNPLTDPASCGGCGVPCEEGGQCLNGACGPGPCEPGLGECDGDAATGCETDLISNASNCGRCRAVCPSGVCSGGMCAPEECPEGFADCNQQASDLCEANLNSLENCQICGKACSDLNGEASCTDEGCAIACDSGYGDCDEDADTGCEVNLGEDAENCGACGMACSNENGATECVDGECQPTCANGFDDCDGNPTNGCETEIDSELSDCGACGSRCDPDNATGSCTGGVCEAECAEGFADCNGSVEDGCEADLSSPETCGSCDDACSANGGAPICNEDGSCGITCDPGRADCINGVADGCETNTNLSVIHCGGCGIICPGAVGTPACNDGICGVSSCTDPNAECDGDPNTLCETDVTDDPQNCNGCGMECFFPNGTGVCVNRGCLLDECNQGFADCTAGLGCETRLGTVDNCRSCGETCRNDHGTTECTATGCAPTCQTGWGDCDGNRNNGCETPLDTLTNCGGCGVACDLQNAGESCATRSCRVTTCDSGFRNCDGSHGNGCETPINTLGNCGGCGVTCNLANASESCATGQCTLVSCNSGFADCTTQAGCETTLGTTSNCLGCGDACTNANGGTSCVTGGASPGCTPTCDPGWKSCDGNRANGCERNIRTLSDCGDCGVACALDHASESCSTGTCTLGTCDTGWGNCDALAGTGCETPLGTLGNCLSCGNACTNAHGSTACNSSSGCDPTCSTGWDSCDANLVNGCETSIWSLSDCGACGVPCDIPGSNESCGGGTCQATTCTTGFANCNANPDCETQLGTLTNCRSCGEACTNPNGTTSCNATTGCSPTCSVGWMSCDGSSENGCERNIRTLTDCNACDTPCSFPNAAASCSTGTCTMGSCNAGFANCNAGAGCETTLGTATNCAACGNQCTNDHGSNACTGTPGNFDCSPTCDNGWRSCDSNPDNGCEQSVTTLQHCGACNTPCSFPNSAASCATGTCVPTGCSQGFLDCTAAAGCETPIGTAANCAACGNQCTNDHGGNTCVNMAGVYDCSPTCDAGWASCDSNPDNGCERSIRTTTDCNGCNVPCARANAAASCSTGTCTLGACNAGFGNCDGNAANGCETTLGTINDCAACGNACTNSHGTTSCTGPVGNKDCAPVCEANWGSCDSNPDNGCEADLTTTSNCGQCGRACSGATPFCVEQAGGAYNCAGFLTISLVNSSTTGANGSSAALDINHTLQTTSGNFRLIAALISSDGNSQSTARPSAVTYNGNAMTVRRETWSGNRVLSSIYTIGEGSLPGSSATPYTVRVTGAEFGKIVNVYELRGVDQNNPVAAVGGGSGSNCANDNPSDSISTNVANTFLLTTVGTFGTDAGSPATGQTQTYSFTNGAMGFKAGYLANLMTGGFTVTWNMTNCNASAHALVTLRPATAP